MFPTLKIAPANEQGIAIVGICRPDAKNALDTATIEALGQCLKNLEADAGVKAVIVTGEGKTFGIGADIPEIRSANDDARLQTLINAGGRVFRQLEKFSKPTCAAINGVFCFGGSMELALACTFRVAAKKCRMGLPEVSLGLIPGYGGTQRLPRLIGKGRALELILTGEPIRAEDAQAIGLIHKASEDGEEVKDATALLERVLKNGPLAVRAALAAVTDGLDAPSLEAALQIERGHFVKIRATADANEGLAANQEKRKPVFKGQ